MMNDIQVIAFEPQSPDYQKVLDIRKEVFTDEQKTPWEEELDAYELDCRYYIALSQEIPCGTGRWRMTQKGAKIERIAVLAAYRKRKVGVAIMEAILQDIEQQQAQVPNGLVYLHAQEIAANFYKTLGFQVQGDSFEETNIIHVYMYKRLA